ncbi:putative bifunctional diguanylate cyclase/phosphodiesterase [Dyella japonica]|uniref:putative bifunctional diguanylate cyclase/phosphodiesterase n=1 Tax=Dyella japonica TaxID=231455 RepID=UPI00031FD54C|nr:EAL domain-containing protein [Dyella japonica]
MNVLLGTIDPIKRLSGRTRERWNRVISQFCMPTFKGARSFIGRMGKPFAKPGRQKALLRALLESSPDAMWIKDHDGTYIACNSRAARNLGLQVDDVIGKRDADLFDCETARRHLTVDQTILAGEVSVTSEGKYVDARTGDVYVLESIKTAVYHANGDLLGVLGIARDITDRKRAEERLSQAAKVVESTSEGVMITDTSGRIISVNQALCTITGYSEQEVLGQTPGLLDVADRDFGLMQAIWSSVRHTHTWQGEIWNKRKNGERYPVRWAINSVRDRNGNTTHYAGVATDLSRIKRYEDQLDYKAHYDEITGLPNRTLAMEQIDHRIRIGLKGDEKLAVLLIDLDFFKRVNESLGHLAGNKLLQHVAERISCASPDANTVARLGSDEFAIILAGRSGLAEVEDTAKRIIAAMSSPFDVNGNDVYIGCTIGISVYPTGGCDSITMLTNADTALSHAKRQARNSFCFYNPTLTYVARQFLDLDASLRRALELNEFELYYQPQICLATGAIRAVEALLRWNRPGVGMVSPAAFIAHAEQTGLIVPIGQWVVMQACKQLSAWQSLGLSGFRISVNLSPSHLTSPDLIAQIRASLASTGAQPEMLELEITETTLMEHHSSTRDVLQDIKKLGVTLAIDDFGTGYSSLAYLQQFPVDLIKIDRRFINDAPANARAEGMLASIIAMARHLHMDPLVEGVETEAQCRLLHVLGCDYAQGNYFSAPTSAGDVTSFLQNSKKNMP